MTDRPPCVARQYAVEERYNGEDDEHASYLDGPRCVPTQTERLVGDAGYEGVAPQGWVDQEACRQCPGGSGEVHRWTGRILCYERNTHEHAHHTDVAEQGP